MSYTITLTDGTVFATIADGTINTTASPALTLVGKNYAGYGQFLNTNFIRVLENSSNPTAPPAPITGQLWWDNSPTDGRLQINTNNTTTGWKYLSAIAVGNTTPSASIYNAEGDLWFDTGNQQVNIWTGSAWILVGPQFTAGTGVTGAFANVITDTTGTVVHKVIELVVDSVVVGIMSGDATWTPLSAIPGFGNISSGIQLASNVTGIGGTTAPTFWGQGASGVNVAGNIVGGNITTAGLITATGNVSSGNLRSAGSITAVGNVLASGLASITGNIIGGNILTAGLISITGNITGGNLRVTNITNTTGNITGNIGNSTSYFNTVFANTFSGTSTTALYADVAERFAADDSYAPGTVVELGGSAEITRSTTELSDSVFGVISTRAAYLMNSGAGSDLTHPPVAMTGRVPVQCTGVVCKGDRLVSAGNGLARSAAVGEATAFNTIGRALVDKLDSGVGTVEAIVTIK